MAHFLHLAIDLVFVKFTGDMPDLAAQTPIRVGKPPLAVLKYTLFTGVFDALRRFIGYAHGIIVESMVLAFGKKQNGFLPIAETPSGATHAVALVPGNPVLKMQPFSTRYCRINAEL